jgi:hypothetical protein
MRFIKAGALRAAHLAENRNTLLSFGSNGGGVGRR